jgi:PAS domain S-box-containing protein
MAKAALVFYGLRNGKVAGVSLVERAASVYKDFIFPGGLAADPPPLTEIQKSMLDVTPDCIKLLSSDGILLTMNKAGCLALGVSANSEFGMPWLSLLPEGVRHDGREALAEAAQGLNSRFSGESRNPDGTRYWDNLLTPITDTSGTVRAILCVSRDVTAKTRAEKDLQDALKREQLLSQEVQHRIKNAFAVMSGLIFISEREAASANAPETTTAILREKVYALARASDAAFSPTAIRNVGSESVEVAAIVTSVLQPYGNRCKFAGESLSISYKNMTTVTLFLHEFATNSVKYGSLGSADGGVAVSWAPDGPDLRLTWSESGGPPVNASPAKEGFGSQMLAHIVQSAGGQIEKYWHKEGLIAKLYLPNPPAASGEPPR